MVHDPRAEALISVWALRAGFLGLSARMEFGCCGTDDHQAGFGRDVAKAVNNFNPTSELARKWRRQGHNRLLNGLASAGCTGMIFPEFYPELVEKHGLRGA